MGWIVRIIVWFSKFTAKFSRYGFGDYESWQRGEKIKFLLVGYNGARNTGADARVVAIVEQIEKLFGKNNAEISIMTLNPDNIRSYYGSHINLIQFSSVFFFDLYRACSVHHVAILCEGSTLKSTFANALTMFFCEAAGIMKRQGKPCLAYGSEAGKMDAFLEKMARDMCSGTYFIARNSASLARIESLGLKGHIGTDTAWTFKLDEVAPERVEQELKETGWDGQAPLLGVAVINPFWWPVKPSLWKLLKASATRDWSLQFSKWYFFSHSPKRAVLFENYLDQIAQAINQTCAARRNHVVIIGMEQLDADACNKLRDKLNQPCSVFLSSEYDAYEITGVLRRLSVLITSRYHARVLSMETCVPTVAVSMDERLDNIMTETGFQDVLLHHVDDAGLSEKLLQSLRYIDKNTQAIYRQTTEVLPYYLGTMEDMGRFLKNWTNNALLNRPLLMTEISCSA